MLEASAFQALQAQAPYRGIIKPPVELVVHDLCHSKNNPPAMQGEESSLDERTPMLE